MASQSTWPVEESERLKGLILRHVSLGGSVLEACQQFEFETSGKHTAKNSRMRWLMYLQWTCRDAYKQALHRAQNPGSQPEGMVSNESQMSNPGGTMVQAERINPIGIVDGTQLPSNVEPTQEVMTLNTQSSFSNLQAGFVEDESATRLLNAVSHVLEDRRQLKDDLQEHRKQIELSERRIHEVEAERKAADFKLRQRESELERQERLLLDSQYKFQQLQEDFQQLMMTKNSEYERLQQQIRESQEKYEVLSQDYAVLRRDSSSQVERLEVLLRSAEMRSAQLSSEAEEVRKENANLTRRIQEFAHQISNMLGQAPVNQPNITPVPIRPVLTNVKNEEDRVNA